MLDTRKTPAGRRFIKAKTTFRKLGISDATGWRMIKDGRLPKPIMLGDKLRVFDEAVIDRLMDDLATEAEGE